MINVTMRIFCVWLTRKSDSRFYIDSLF